MGTISMAETKLRTDDKRFENDEWGHYRAQYYVSGTGQVWRRRDFIELDKRERNRFKPDTKFQRSEEFRSSHWHRDDWTFKPDPNFTKMAKSRFKRIFARGIR